MLFDICLILLRFLPKRVLCSTMAMYSIFRIYDFTLFAILFHTKNHLLLTKKHSGRYFFKKILSAAFNVKSQFTYQMRASCKNKRPLKSYVCCL